ncbi:fumarate hydratase [Alphaproteobacteria bacterium]|nr:fumarate hydratase [Alphaproteobacteria bacterium]
MDNKFQPIFEFGKDETKYKKISNDFVSLKKIEDRDILHIEPQALELLARQAMKDIAHLLRADHLKQLAQILEDDEASNNDKYVAYELLKNANIASGMILPGCQDTGTAIIFGYKGERVWTGVNDEEYLSKGIEKTYLDSSLRYSQMAPIDMFNEVNTGNNLPAQIDIYSNEGNYYKFLFIAKGGGSANKTFLYQQTRSVLEPEKLINFIKEKIKSLGTAACPPYHLAVVIGGTSAEYNLKTVKLASSKYLDSIPTKGNKYGRAFRDLNLEKEIHNLTRELGIGAQFGGKYFCHDVRVIRLPRHGASVPIGIGVSCSADRQALGKITHEGIFLEELETNPARFMPEIDESQLGGKYIDIDLNQPMYEILKELTKYEIKTRLMLSGSMIVARDIAHAKIRERLKSGKNMPEYFKEKMIYYAGPAKTPEGYASGSFGPTTAGRMDDYVDEFMSHGGSMISLAKGNRSKVVMDACKKYGGFYLGSIGGPAAKLASDCIKKVEVLEYPELGMEAIWKIEVKNFPAFIVIDDKGNDFFSDTIGSN